MIVKKKRMRDGEMRGKKEEDRVSMMKGETGERRSELTQGRVMNHIAISLSLSSLMVLIFKCYIIKNQSQCEQRRQR